MTTRQTILGNARSLALSGALKEGRWVPLHIEARTGAVTARP